jgi:isoleucyl-tRNA synthetase
VKPEFEYSVIEHDGANYILATELVNAVTQKFGWSDYKAVKLFKGATLEHLRYRHPFIEREGAFVLGDYVTLDAGTGLVHTAPGHGADDFATGRRYGLDIYTPVNHRGEFTPDVRYWAGCTSSRRIRRSSSCCARRGSLIPRDRSRTRIRTAGAARTR